MITIPLDDEPKPRPTRILPDESVTNLLRFVMTASRGRITDTRTAIYVVLAAVGFLALLALIIFFRGGGATRVYEPNHMLRGDQRAQ